MLRPVAIYAASRAVVWTMVLLGVTAGGSALPRGAGVGDALSRWDAAWYVAIAQHGYERVLPTTGDLHNRAAFFPLFPLLIRSAAAITGISDVVAGTAMNLVLGLVATVLLWFLVRRFASAETADRAALLLAFFPGAFVFSWAYTEGLAITLALACLALLADRRWALAGLAAALATATRADMAALMVVCGWTSWVAIRQRREWRSVAAPLLAPAGIAAYFAYLWAHTGVADAWFRAEWDGWHQSLSITHPFAQLRAFVEHPFSDLNASVSTLCIVFVAVSGLAIYNSRLPKAWLIFAVVVLLPNVLGSAQGITPRRLLLAFPLLVLVAEKLKPLSFQVVLALSAALMAGLALITATTGLLTP
ncbi:MAG TPA: mannosyltransferase family protein [Acidimicrobiales bacterium]|nr:mannosyltransferase family protein [Acidimicrobiales bacterium]